MKKKLLTMMLACMLVVSLLAGCGSKEESAAAEPAQEAEEAPAPKAAEAEPAEAAETSSGLTFQDLQNNYATLVDLYNQVEDLYMNDKIAQDDNIESLLSEAKGLIDQMGEATEEDFSSEQDLQDMNDAMVTMAESLGKIVDGMTVTESGTEGAEDDIIAQLKSQLTLGYAGASEAGEELYLATDDNVDVGILGIINGGEATFLAGSITEENGKLTITDNQSGDSLTFSIQEDTDDEGTPVLILNVTSNGTAGALYSVDASDVIDKMAQY